VTKILEKSTGPFLLDSNCNTKDNLHFEECELTELAELTDLCEFDFDVLDYIKTLDFQLRKWAIKNNVSLVATSELLKILKKRGHPSLPMDARTLLKTPAKVNVVKMGSGQFWYGGLKTKLVDVCKKNKSQSLELTLHIDGTPVYKSSKSEFWPIQCSVNGIEMKAFFVCLYKARSFLKSIISHSGYFSCERCEEKGEYLRKIKKNGTTNGTNLERKRNAGHVCLVGTNAPLRTDNSFRSRENEEHHNGVSPLEELPIDMIRDIPLEYLHLVLYGIMKRLLTMWMEGTKNFKFSDSDISEISEKHIQANCTKPSEIVKSNRSLRCLSFWKAAEFRTFLLKTGPIALQGSLTGEMYNHFMALHCGVTICTSEKLNKFLPVARSLFRSFTERFGEIYGNEYATYSTHSLIHVVDDVERLGVLDNYSAFPGESNLGFLKNLVRGGHLPLQQVIKRLAERELCEKICQFEKEKEKGRMEGLHKNILRLKGLRLDSSEKNRWILTKKMEIFKIERMSENRTIIEIHGAALLKENQENLYDLPIKSKQLFTFKSKLVETPLSITLGDMFCKLYRIQIDNEKSAFLPLFHYTQ
ncbi:hypothetical protein HA402_007963, partial [Bradysia odoriphaga]